MRHCDSKDDIEKREDVKLDMYSECTLCNSEQSRSEESLPVRECRKCGVEHLVKNMFQKLTGWLCYTCANEYEQALMKVAQ